MKSQLTHARLIGTLTVMAETLVAFYRDPSVYTYTSVLASSLQLSKLLKNFKNINPEFATQTSRQEIEARQQSLFPYDGP